jgi:uncharacterized protein
MKKIGLLSDTHSYLDPQIFEYFKEVDEIWHAGDIGSIEILDQLKAFKPIKAVYGNIDDHVIRKEVPEFNHFLCEKVSVLITHIAGKPYKYVERAHKEIEKIKPKLFICGHSHILLVQMDKKFNMLWMNPGACGFKGFHKVKTVLRFEIDGEKIQNLEAIELGNRI